ncbi:MAG: hypothetical protein IBJ09_08530 [Bacteroidia bacterium]|nr:hypothetical protein [Bacteroidia bacterium]
MRVLFCLLFFGFSLALRAQNDTLRSTGNKAFDAFLSEMEAYAATKPPGSLIMNCERFRQVWVYRVDNREQTISSGNGQPLCGPETNGQPAGFCLRSRYIGDRYYVCSYEEPTGSVHSTTWYYMLDSSEINIQKEYADFLAEIEAYKSAPHAPDVPGPCEEYKLVWHYSNHSFFENVERGDGEALCKGKKTEHPLTGGCWPLVIGDRYYICTIDIPVSTIRQDVYYYERQTPEKKP